MKFDKNGIAITMKEKSRLDINRFYNAPNIASFYEQRMQTRMDFKWRLKNEI